MKCNKCGKCFLDPAKYFNHRKQHCAKKICPNCGDSFSQRQNLDKHIKKKKKIDCDHCNRTFCNDSHFQKHLRSIRRDTTANGTLRQLIFPATGYQNSKGFLELINKKINEIQDRHKKTQQFQVINKRIDSSFTYQDLNDLLMEIYKSQGKAFKINFGIGFILYNTITGVYKYHYVSNNNLLFDEAVLITNPNDITKLMKHILSLDLATNFYLKKPSSSWILAGLTNIEIIVTYQNNTLLG